MWKRVAVLSLLVAMALMAAPTVEAIQNICVNCLGLDCEFYYHDAHRFCMEISGGCLAWDTCRLNYRITP